MSHLYVIQFSTGVVKVGKSNNPHARIAQHEISASRFGVSIAHAWHRLCKGDVEASEQMLINWCTATAARVVFGRECFESISIDRVVEQADRIAATDVAPKLSGMDALKQFLRSLESDEARAAFAEKVETSIGHLRNCINEAGKEGGKRLNAETCVSIEQESKKAVMRWDMRPSDWHRIWPELLELPGAPEVAA